MNTLTYFSVKHAAPGRSRGVYLNEDHAIFHSDYYCAFYPHKDLGRAEEEVYRVYDGQATQFWFDAETGKCGGIRAVVHAAGWTILNDYGELKAGGGLYWGARNSLSTLNRAFLVRGQQDQKRAEIWAVTEAIRLAWKERFSTMTIITDSDFTINCILEGWLERWKADHWLDIHNHPVAYAEDLIELDKIMERFGGERIRMEHIHPQSGNLGHEQAKHLALRGARRMLNGDYCLPWVR